MNERQPTKDEIERYDRQMRLWGEDSQRRILNAVVYVDYLSDLSSEVIKNLVLKGIGKLLIGVIPCEKNTLQALNRNNVFHILKGETQAERIRQLNPHVEVIVTDASVEVEQNHIASTKTVFVYHSVSGACTHQKKLFTNPRDKSFEHIDCFCIQAFGDLGRITRFNVEAASIDEVTNHRWNAANLSAQAGPLERDIFVVEKRVLELVQNCLSERFTEISQLSANDYLSEFVPEFRHVVEYLLVTFKAANCDLPDDRICFLADCTLSAFKTMFIQMVSAEFSRQLNIQFISRETHEMDLTVSMGVELCSVLGGLASQEVVKSITSQVSADTGNVATGIRRPYRSTFVDAFDRCECVVEE